MAWLLSLLLLLAASQRGAFLSPTAGSVYNIMMAAARGIDAILPTTATPAVDVAARLNPTTRPLRFGKGSSREKHALLAENVRSTAPPKRLSNPIHQYSLKPTASRKSTKL